MRDQGPEWAERAIEKKWSVALRKEHRLEVPEESFTRRVHQHERRYRKMEETS
jgi:hypothetical protein